MPRNKPIFPNKAKVIRRANVLLVDLAVVPVIYLIVAFLLELSGESFATNLGFVLQVFLVLALFSLATLGMTIFVMTSKRLVAGTARYGPLWRTFQIMSIGSILSETHAVFGLILTFLSGSIFYLVGFSVVAWASLLWVRGRFRQNLEKLPDAQSS